MYAHTYKQWNVLVVVQSLSLVQLSATPWMAAHQPSVSFTISRSLLKLMSVELVMLSSHLILSHRHLLLPSIFPSIKILSSKSALCISWPNDWSFSISPSNEYSGLTSCRVGWFDLLAVQGTLKSLLQCHSSNSSSSVLSLLYGPTLTTIHDCWQNRSFDNTDLCWQSECSGL